MTTSLTLAHFRRRFLADLIDLVVILGLTTGLVFTGAIATPDLSGPYGLIDTIITVLAHPWQRASSVIIATLAGGLLYPALAHWRWGRTLGDALFGLRLTTTTGQPAGLLRAVFHAFGTQLALALLTGGYIWALADRRRRTLAEWLSGTLLLH